MSPVEGLKLGAFCLAVLVAVGFWIWLCERITRALWPPGDPSAPATWEASRRRDRWFKRLVVGGLGAGFGVPALLFFAGRDDWWGKLSRWCEEPAPAVGPVDLRPEADLAPVGS